MPIGTTGNFLILMKDKSSAPNEFQTCLDADLCKECAQVTAATFYEILHSKRERYEKEQPVERVADLI